MKKFVSPYGATGRRNFVILVLLICFLIVLGRVIYLQVYHADFLVDAGNSRFVRIKKEPALRGSILDRNNIPLAVSTPTSAIWIDPKEILKHKGAIDKLSSVMNYDAKSLSRKVTKKKKSRFMYIKRGLEPELAKIITQQKIPAVYSLREYRRYYPSSDVTSQIIGFNNIDDEGQEGLELLYDGYLAGKPGSSEIIRDAKGRIVDVIEEIKPPVQGNNLKLTIDKRIQYLAYVALLNSLKETSAKTATAVILDAKTSEVLAMVSAPSGNPNNPKEKRVSLLKNRALTDVFESGSVLKPFTIIEGLEKKVITPSQKIDTSPGVMMVNENKVDDGKDYGVLSVEEVIKKSSNVGTCKVALKVSKYDLHQLYANLELGKKTQITFPGESSGVLRDFTKMSDFDYCTNSYGYGSSVNVLQLAQAYASIANDGVFTPAKLIKDDYQSKSKRVFSKQSAQAAREMLAMAVEEGGTGTKANEGDYMEEYRVGGKTGTVHKVIDGEYSEDRYRSVFVGMAPIENPELVMAIMVDDPQGDYYGGLVAAPIFSKVIGKALRIMGVSPSKSLLSEQTTLVEDKR